MEAKMVAVLLGIMFMILGVGLLISADLAKIARSLERMERKLK